VVGGRVGGGGARVREARRGRHLVCVWECGVEVNSERGVRGRTYVANVEFIIYMDRSVGPRKGVYKRRSISLLHISIFSSRTVPPCKSLD